MDMRSSPLSIEFADGVPQTYHKSTLRVSLSEQRAESEGRSESQEADPTAITTNTSPRRVFFFSLLKPEVGDKFFSSLCYMLY